MNPRTPPAPALIEKFRDKNVIVLGDVMLDEFTWGQVTRVSPEAPVPVVEVLGDTYRPGGSANVAANIRSLGGRPVTIGVMGDDASARRLVELFRNEDMSPDLIVEDRRLTTVKTRIIAHNQQVVRTDREDRTPLAAPVKRKLIDRFLSALPEASAVVVSDYDKGVVDREVLAAALPAAESAGVPVFLDPKVNHADYYRPITILTPNSREAELLSGRQIRDRESLEDAGRVLLERFGCPWVLITRGRDGMSLFAAGYVDHLPAAAREVFDVSGAGDTVVATLALARAAGADFGEAAWLANHAAGIVVGKLGTAVVAYEELRRFLNRAEP